MKRIVTSLFGGFFLSALACSLLWAQATAQINGRVTDQTGAVLPGVDITATQTDTGITRTTITDETGAFVLPNLATGPYRVEAALAGFRTFVQTGIVLQVNSSPVINAILEVGQVTDQVEVQANATMVETRSQGVGTVIENERILELPLNGRQATDLIVLTGAAVQVGTNNNRSMSGGVAISVSGGSGQGVSYSLDGAMHTNPYNNMNLPLPFPDALQEFKVESSGLSAQNGWSTGASVNSVTRSGTNDLHGGLFEFVRNDLTNARNYFATRNSSLKRNQFGGTVGGPIMPNKMFFFAGYQGTTLRQDPADRQAFVPTAAMLAGDFTTITSPSCNGRQVALNAPFVNNRIDTAQFSKAALNLAGKLPTTTDPCGLVTFGTISKEDQHQVVGKMDYQWSDKQSVFGRYLGTKVKNPDPYSLSGGNLLTANFPGLDNLAQSFTVGDTYLVSANTVNSFRLGMNRTSVTRLGPEYFSGPDLGIKMYSYLPKFLGVTVTGGFSIGGGTSSAAAFVTNAFSISNDVNLVRGAHQLSIGASLAHWRIYFDANIVAAGSFAFDSSNTGLGLADFLTGRTSQLTQGTPNLLYPNQWYAGVYVQDNWRVTPRFTINAGVRWEPYFPQVLRNGTVYNWSEERYKAGVKSTIFKNAPAGFYYPGDPGFIGVGKCKETWECYASGSPKQWGNFGPRIGLAWDVHGDGRMSVRAAYGMAYEFVNAQFHSSTTQASPWGSEVRIPNPVGGFDDPWLNFPGGNQFPRTFDANATFVPFGTFLVIPTDLKNTQGHTWNLSVQRQVARDWLLSASYIGRQTAHLWHTKALNDAVFVPGASTAANRDRRRRIFLENPEVGQYIGYLDSYDDGSTQNYQGMLVSAQRRVANGLTVSANHTWSHCVGAVKTGSSNYNPAQNYLDNNDREFEYGNCEGDRRRIFNLTAVAETPQFANATLRMLATNWRLSGIFRRSTGSWLTVTTSVDRTLNGVTNQRPNQILVDPYGDRSGKPLSQYINLSAFALPTLGTIGNMRPGNIEGPAQWQFDLAVSRSFQIIENQRLEFRAEAYNVTNSFRPENPGTNISQTNTFGQLRVSQDPRIMQFALKYAF